MARPSNRDQRRAQLLAAFARVLAQHGYAGATIGAIAAEAGLAPGLVHHHFDDKAELLRCLFAELGARFRARFAERLEGTDPLLAYGAAALELDARSDVVAAKCWVSLFAEALREPALFEQVRRFFDTELAALERRTGLGPHDAGAVLAYVTGALVLGAFAPRKTAGFAAPGFRRLVAALRAP